MDISSEVSTRTLRCDTYKFDNDVSIYLLTADRNVFVHFSGDCRQSQTTLGAYYRGTLRCVESHAPECVGMRYSGFWDFSPPELADHVPKRGFMNCVAEEPTSWFCLHSEGKYTKVAMEEFEGSVPYTVEGVTFYFGN